MFWAMRIATSGQEGDLPWTNSRFLSLAHFCICLVLLCFAWPAGGRKDIELGDSFSWDIVQELRRVLFNMNVLIIEWTEEGGNNNQSNICGMAIFTVLDKDLSELKVLAIK